MRGLETNGLIEILQSQDESTTKLIFKQDGQPLFVMLPTDTLRAMMPQLIAATVVNQDEGAIAITVESGAVGLDEAGDVLLTLKNTAGAEMIFSFPQSVALQISALLDTALQGQSGSNRTH